MTSAFFRSGCRLRCKCDEERGYYGKDPCSCKRYYCDRQICVHVAELLNILIYSSNNNI